MDYENPKIRTFKESVKAVPLASPLVGAFRAWKRVKWTLFKEMYRKRYGEYLHHNGMRRPVMLSCETVNICSNDCIFCSYRMMEREKKVMEMALFEKVLKDYTELGGGFLSLTPLLGDVFFDDLLVERMRLLERYDRITSVSFITNTVMSEKFDDEDLAYILSRLSKLCFSVYGLDPEEHRTMTRTENYDRVIRNIKRIISLAGDIDKIHFCFRLFKTSSDDELCRWIKDNFAVEAPFKSTNTFFNWGGSVATDKALPFDGRWEPVTKNKEPCFMPILGRILSNGVVTFCQCDDSDGGGGLSMGNVSEKPLSEIFGSERMRKLWEFADDVKMPAVCRQCTFHRPMSNLPSNEFLFEEPLEFVGA